MVERQDELVDSMSQVPGNMKKIAGKSLPIEVCLLEPTEQSECQVIVVNPRYLRNSSREKPASSLLKAID
jgi:hypothetical protein